MKPSDLISVGDLDPAVLERYQVAYCGKHPTLAAGDIVIVRETPFPHRERVLVRLMDWTLHLPFVEKVGCVLVTKVGVQ